ncbi:hypothetical protein NPIL_493981 [Nephila pilipes]|uniref:Uncharacterized protein n=1 Tax=Nephila pilipes TaxID=299642 RepID=A0A8X6UCR5_NEPPI|nr:hypothetical protein NPIL_493981 [Nephila pilipes]
MDDMIGSEANYGEYLKEERAFVFRNKCFLKTSITLFTRCNALNSISEEQGLASETTLGGLLELSYKLSPVKLVFETDDLFNSKRSAFLRE